MGHPGASADAFRAIADPTRRAILDLLSEGEQRAGELAAPFAMSLAAVSQHLRVLREVGLVSERRQGRERVYCLEAAPLREVSEWVVRYEQFWKQKLDALDEFLKRDP